MERNILKSKLREDELPATNINLTKFPTVNYIVEEFIKYNKNKFLDGDHKTIKRLQRILKLELRKMKSYNEIKSFRVYNNYILAKDYILIASDVKRAQDIKPIKMNITIVR